MIVQRQQGRWLDLFSARGPNMIGQLSNIVSEAEQMAMYQLLISTPIYIVYSIIVTS
jgi:hypothetical protein